MAASATNTSREIGAVTGVAILGALVFSQLNSSLNREPARPCNVPVGEKAAILGFKSTIISLHRDGPGADATTPATARSSAR